MANLDDLLKKATAKAAPSLKTTKRDFGIKKTMASMNQTPEPSSVSVSSPVVNEVAPVSLANDEIKVETLVEPQVPKVSAPSPAPINNPTLKATTAPLLDVNAPPHSDIPIFKPEGMRQLDSSVLGTDTSSVPSTEKSSFTETLTSSIKVAKTEQDLSVPSTVQSSVPSTVDASVPSTVRASQAPPPVAVSESIQVVTKDLDLSVPSTVTSSVPSTVGTSVPSTDGQLTLMSQDSYVGTSEPVLTKTKLGTDKASVPSTDKKSFKELGTQPTVLGTQNELYPVHVPSTDQTSVLGTKIIKLNRLRGLSKDLFMFIALEALKSSDRTVVMQTKVLREKFDLSLNSLRIALRRLKDDYDLFHFEALSEGGSQAARKFTISHEVAQAVVNLVNPVAPDPSKNWVQKRDLYPVHVPSTDASSKLVSNINTNLLGTEDRDGKPQFSHVDISALSRYGISKKQLADLENQRLSLTTFQLEDLIWKFSKYAADSSRVAGVRNFAGLFCKMAQQLSGGTDPLADIKTPEEEALEKQIEASKRALVERVRFKEEAKAMKFEEWYMSLDQSHVDEIVPPNNLITSGSPLQKKKAMAHFESHVWPQLEKNLFT